MPDRPDIHTDIASFVLGRLTPAEHARVARHLATSASARNEERELREVIALLRGTSPVEPTADLEARTLAAIAAIAPEAPAPAQDELAGRRARRLPRRVSALTVAAAVVAALLVGAGAGALLASSEDAGPVVAQAGVTELDTALVPEGATKATARALVTRVDSGRVIRIRSKTLPVLPTGVYYELWFVGPGDTPEKPNRISGGTWHPDPDGTTDVTFRAAADPAKLPVLEVTREPGDGSPVPTLPGVVRSIRSQ